MGDEPANEYIYVEIDSLVQSVYSNLLGLETLTLFLNLRCILLKKYFEWLLMEGDHTK